MPRHTLTPITVVITGQRIALLQRILERTKKKKNAKSRQSENKIENRKNNMKIVCEH